MSRNTRTLDTRSTLVNITLSLSVNYLFATLGLAFMLTLIFSWPLRFPKP